MMAQSYSERDPCPVCRGSKTLTFSLHQPIPVSSYVGSGSTGDIKLSISRKTYPCPECSTLQNKAALRLDHTDAGGPGTMKDAGEILRALFSNPHADLEGYIYAIRDRELKGWDGPAVKAWSDSVVAAKRWLKENPQ